LHGTGHAWPHETRKLIKPIRVAGYSSTAPQLGTKTEAEADDRASIMICLYRRSRSSRASDPRASSSLRNHGWPALPSNSRPPERALSTVESTRPGQLVILSPSPTKSVGRNSRPLLRDHGAGWREGKRSSGLAGSVSFHGRQPEIEQE
jgi:hypothetical protein